MTDDELRGFARAAHRFLDWVYAQSREDADGPAATLLSGHLGDRLGQPVVARTLPAFQHVNVQVALDAYAAAPGRDVAVHGLAGSPDMPPLGLHQLLHGGMPPVRLTAPDLVDLPSGPGGRTLACLRAGLLLVTDARGPYALGVRGPAERYGEPQVTLEVAGLPAAAAQEVLGELDGLRRARDVHRGHVLELAGGEPGGFGLAFLDLPPTARADVVLPEPVLRRVERHTVDVARHRDALRAAGQHLKRGVLLHGPPGTGKTHTMRYLLQRLDGYTRVVLSGQALPLVGETAGLARELAPAVVVCEDVDLVAEERDYSPGGNPVLFELLDAMDGAAADADLVFLLTTNRADLLEPALAARPGRVDVAVEIGLPGADGRRRLLALYGGEVVARLSEAEVDEVVARTEGTTASFAKELLRRAVLEALEDGGSPRATAAHLGRALDDLLDSAQGVTRALLGVPGAGAGAGGPEWPDDGDEAADLV